MRWKQKVRPKLIAYTAKFLMRLVMMTCRYETKGLAHFIKAAQEKKCILCVWHNRVALIPEIMSRLAPQFHYAGFVSNSRDGEIIAAITESYAIGNTIRVAHDARADALKKMIAHLKYSSEILVVTPDGPKGPVYEVKPGVAIAAFKSAAKVVPMCWKPSRYFRIRSWDKMIFPKPFSLIEVTFGEAVSLQSEEPEAVQDAMSAICDFR